MNIQRAFVNTSLYTLVGLLQKSAGILLLPFYTRHMSPEDYGLVATVTAVASVCTVLMGLGLRRAAGRFYFDAPDDRDYLAGVWGTILAMTLVTVAGVGILLLLVAPVTIQPWLDGVSVYPYLLLGILVAAGQPFQAIYAEIVRMQQKGRTYAIYQSVLFVSNIGLGLLLVVVFEMSALGALLSYAITSLLGAAIAVGLLHRHVRWSIDRKILPELLSYSVPVLPHAIFATLIASLDKILLNGLDSARAAGLYAVGVSLAASLKIITNSTNQAVRPVAFGLFGEFSERRRDYLNATALVILSAYSLVAVGASLLAPEIVRLFASEQFSEAWVVVPILLYGRFLHGVYYVYSLGLHYEKRAAKLLFLLSSLGLAINVIGNLLLIPSIGVWGAAVATMLASLGYVILGRQLSRRVHEMRWPDITFALLALVTLVACSAVYFIDDLTLGWWTSLYLKAAVGLVFAIAMGLFGWSKYRIVQSLESQIQPE